MSTLARDLVPLASSIVAEEKAKGDQASRFRIAMGESALGMAGREEAQHQALIAAQQALDAFGTSSIASIRAGSVDGEGDLYLRLLISSILRTSVTRPAMLQDEDRELAGLE
jgi:hypothetical protein